VLIGKTITITESKNKSITNKHGKVIDETKNTITITTPKQLTIIKDQITTITIEEQ